MIHGQFGKSYFRQNYFTNCIFSPSLFSNNMFPMHINMNYTVVKIIRCEIAATKLWLFFVAIMDISR